MSIKHLSILLLFLFLIPASGYLPPEPGFVQQFQYNTNSTQNVIVGDIVELQMVIKNLSNDTASNFTISQTIPTDVTVVSLADMDLVDGVANFSDFTASDVFNGEQLQVHYLNFTENDAGDTVYTINIDKTLQPVEMFGFSMKINFTASGAYTFTTPTVKYYDHWPDLNSAETGANVRIQVGTKTVRTETKFIPRPDTEKLDPKLYVIGLVVLALIALVLGPIVHLKKPFNL